MFAKSLKILRSAFGLFGGRELFPFGAAYGTEQNGVGIFACLDGRIGKRLAKFVDAGAADRVHRIVERVSVLFAGDFENFERRLHYFWPDTVAGQNCEFECGHNITILKII